MRKQQLSFDLYEYYKKCRLELKKYDTSMDAIRNHYYEWTRDFYSLTTKENSPLWSMSIPEYFSKLHAFIEAKRMYMGASYKTASKDSLKDADESIRDETSNALARFLLNKLANLSSEVEDKGMDIFGVNQYGLTIPKKHYKEAYKTCRQISDCYQSDHLIKEYLGMDDYAITQLSSTQIYLFRQYQMSQLGLSDEVVVFKPKTHEEGIEAAEAIKENIEKVYDDYLNGKGAGKSGEIIFKEFMARLMSQIKDEELLSNVLPELNKYKAFFSGGYSLSSIDKMSGIEFETFAASMLKRLGYLNVEVTKASNDQGVDVIAEKNGIRFAIQCKCYTTDLGNTPIQEVNAGKYFYKCHVGVVLTNRYFTKGAKELAEVTGTLLWDRDKLAEMLQVFNQI